MKNEAKLTQKAAKKVKKLYHTNHCSNDICNIHQFIFRSQ